MSILEIEFVDAYIAKFSPNHIIMPWGANKCKELGQLLSLLYRQGILNRFTEGIIGGSEFPKWIYVYQLTELGERMSNY